MIIDSEIAKYFLAENGSIPNRAQSFAEHHIEEAIVRALEEDDG